MKKSADFAKTVRARVRVGRPTLVVHILAIGQLPTKVGFVVSKAVGNAVVRNRIKRQLRHLCIPLVKASPVGLNVVVRALPQAALSPAQLAPDLQSAWAKCLMKVDSDLVSSVGPA